MIAAMGVALGGCARARSPLLAAPRSEQVAPASLSAPSATAVPSATATPTAPSTPTSSPAPSATAMLSVTPAPSDTATPTTTCTPTASPTVTPESTVTPTPLFVLLSDRETLSRYVWAIDGPTPTPTAIPAVLAGKIAFKSDMIDWERVYVVNPDGSDLALLLDRWPYEAACDREWFSQDGRFRVFQAYGRHGLDLFMMSLDGRTNHQLTFVGQGKAYDPSWAPDGLRLAFASNQEGDDDIFVVHFRSLEYPHPRTVKLTHDEGWESDKRPSFSPDGKQIVFQSNRSGRPQIWLMDADGANQRRLLALESDCWDPVWIKP